MKTRNLLKAIGRFERTNPSVAPLARPLRTWVERAGDAELWRMNAFEVADELALDRRQLLETLTTLASAGVFELSWDFHCTSCNAVAATHHHLDEVQAVDHCPLCDVDFRNDLIRNVEVTFTPAPRHYTVGQRFLDREARHTEALHRTKEIRLPEPYVRGIDCLHLPLFREIFESETLSLPESLRIGHVCIMFTDIKGSTALYDRLGDSAAYGLVRTHFEVLFEKIAAHNGTVIKTIGDAVMASFIRASDGVRAAVAIQEAFRALNSRKALRNEILVKIGLHTGSTIMVNLNNRLDYFGQTVNLAARVQESAGGGEVLVSQAVRRDGEAMGELRGRVSSLTRRRLELKGIRAEQTVYRLNFGEEAPVEQERRPGVYSMA